MHRSRTAGLVLAGAWFCFAARAASPSEPERSYTEALRLLKGRNDEAALAALKQIVEQTPSFAGAYPKIVEVYRRSNDAAGARSYFEGLLERRPDLAYPHYALAVFYEEMAQSEEADAHNRRCLELAPDFAPAYAQLVDIAATRSRLGEVIEGLKRSVEKDPSSAVARYALGYAAFRQGDWEGSLRQLTRALELNPQMEAATDTRVLVYRQLNRPTEALEQLRVVLMRSEAKGDREREGRFLGLMGEMLSDVGEYGPAVEHLNRGVEIARELDDRAAEMAYLAQLGIAYRHLGKHEQSLRLYQQALDLARRTGDRLGEGRIVGLIGDAHTQLANYAEATDALLQSAAIAREVKDRPSEADALSSLSSILLSLGDPARALEYLARALSVAREFTNRWLERVFLSKTGAVYESQGDWLRALEAHREAAKIAREIDDRVGEAESLTSLGRVRYLKGDLGEASPDYERALAIAREIGAVAVEGAVLNELGRLHLSRDPGRAEEHHRQALAIGERTEAPTLIWQAHTGLGAVHERREEPAQALAHYALAVETIESVRGKLEIAEEKAGFLQDKIGLYKKCVAILAALEEKEPGKGYRGEAFHYSERARARALLDLMSEAKIDVAQGISPGLLDRQRELSARISRVQTQLIEAYGEGGTEPAATKRRRSLEAELAQADDDYQTLKREIRGQHPAYADLHYPESIGLAATRELLSQDAVLLAFSLAEDVSFLFAVSASDSQMVRLPGSLALERRVTRLRDAISSPGRATFSTYVFEARALYRELIEPVARLLAGKREVIIVPDGILHYLPFEALVAGTAEPMGRRPPRYFVRDYAVSYVPSASVLATLRSRGNRDAKPARALLAFGDPVYGEATPRAAGGVAGVALRTAFEAGKPWKLKRLEHSRDEVRRIAHLYPPADVDFFLGEQASEANVKAPGRLGQYRLIHFATHGLLNERKPQFSGLVLSLPGGTPKEEDGLLQVYEVFNLQLQSDLVVLSACETALGKNVNGEGLVGLTRAFLYAGTDAVVVSLWKVADASTADLMARFYAHLKNGGKTRAEALRAAQLELIDKTSLQHPFYWAPFVLVGKP
jgi:CHAT domain-containing protein/Tfp pilus assembly protein PilF